MQRIGILVIGLRERSRNDFGLPILDAFTDFAEIEYRNRGPRIRVYLTPRVINYACLQMSPHGSKSFSLEPFTLIVPITGAGRVQ